MYVSDFASYKPTYLPLDDPSDFAFYFDTSGRRTCYLAPERFYAPGEDFDPSAPVTWAMDVFSAGCVIAELFLEAPIFSLSQLYRYRRGEYDPVAAHLGRIPDPDLREMVGHMVQLDPQRRYEAQQYLDRAHRTGKDLLAHVRSAVSELRDGGPAEPVSLRALAASWPGR